MLHRGRVFLMFHELEMPGRAPCDSSPGYVRYVVREPYFREYLIRLKSAGLRGLSVGEALAGTDSSMPGVVITFDDGCETDYLAAAPAIQAVGFRGTFYVVSGFVGKPGYIGRGQLRSLNEAGFEIGSHSMSHPYLTELDPGRLKEEVSNSKDQLEQMIGRRVDHFSCPGGRWNRTVLEACREAQYASVATSQIGTNSPETACFRLRRVVVGRSLPAATLDAWSRGQSLFWPRARQVARDALKSWAGNRTYERLRSAVLNR